jgi:hypothetical protein
LVNEVLGNDGLETGKMVKKEYLPGIDVAVGVMHFDVDSEAVAQERKSPYAPLI